MEKTLYALLSGNAGLAAVVGNRIYPEVIPQGGRLPCITYQRVTGGYTYTHDGEDGLHSPIYSLSCWGRDYSEARSVASAVRAAISGYSSGNIHSIQITHELDAYEAEPGYYRVIFSARMWAVVA